MDRVTFKDTRRPLFSGGLGVRDTDRLMLLLKLRSRVLRPPRRGGGEREADTLLPPRLRGGGDTESEYRRPRGAAARRGGGETEREGDLE